MNLNSRRYGGFEDEPRQREIPAMRFSAAGLDVFAEPQIQANCVSQVRKKPQEGGEIRRA